MKAHTSSFKEQIKLMGKEIDSRITFGDTVLGKDDLNAVTPSYQGAILKSVMKQLDIDSNVAIPIGTNLKYEFGLKVNGEYEYINYGNYVVYRIEKQEDTNSYKITCYDKLLYSMLDYVKLPITYPISVRDYINAISTALGLKFANKNGTFANYNKQIQADLYDGLGYTFRDVLDELAQVTASTICLNNNDELEIRYITETGDTIDEEYLKDVNVNFGEKFGAVNTIVLSRSGDSDSVYYPSTLPTNTYEIKISDNQIMNGNDRADFLPDIYNKLNGLEFYTNDFVSTGICYYDLCDRYSVKIGDTTYSCVMFNDEVLITQGLEENIYTELPEQTETDYKYASKDDRMINQVYIIAKKNEAEILALVSTTETIQKEINPTKDESGSEIIIDDASNNPLTYLEIEGKSTQEVRSGKNLSIIDGISNNVVISNELEAGTYTFSLLTDINVGINLKKNSSSGDTLGWIEGTGRLTFTFTLTAKAKIFLNGWSNTTGQGFQENVTEFQIEKGSAFTGYEQYGISPSPNYPSEIESVGYENLFDDNSFLSNTGIDSNGTITNVDQNNLYYIPIEYGKNYIMSFDNTTASGNIVYGFCNTLPAIGVQCTYNVLTIANLNKHIFSAGSINNKYLCIRLNYYNQSSKISNVLFTEGDIVHPYIPYGKYGVEVKTVGKNLLNLTNGTYSNNGISAIVNNGTITLNGTATETMFRTIPLSTNLFINDGEVFTVSANNSVSNSNVRIRIDTNGFYDTTLDSINKVQTITKTSERTLYTSNIIIRIQSGTTLENYVIKPQIEKGKVTTEYQPYQEIILTMLLNAPLRSLPNGVKDIAYIKNNKLYVDRYVGSVVLDGSESWQFNSSKNTFFSQSVTGARDGGYCYSNYFKGGNTNWEKLSNYEICTNMSEGSSNANWVLIKNTDFANANDFKTWLSTHNVQVDYELETPVTEEYGEIEMLKTLKGYNNISTTDDLLPTINLTYVRDTIIADYVENHVTELKLTENEIKASVESVSSSVDGLNTSINRVEEITTDNSQVINVISTNIDKSTGEVREVTTTTGFTFNADGMTIDDGSGFKAEHTADGTYYKDGESVVGQYTKDGSKQKDLELFGTYSYGKESIDDTPMFVGQLYIDENGKECFGHFYNGGDY